MHSSDCFPVHSVQTDAYEVVQAERQGQYPIVFTCEHASNALPKDWTWPPEDGWITGTHWAFDIGAAAVTRRLVERSGSLGILARFSRLLIDPNRDVNAANLCRQDAGGSPIRLNLAVTEQEFQKRLKNFYQPYHETVDRCIRDTPKAPVVAIHSFTPVYAGEARGMEVGVLFDHSDDLAAAVAEALREQGLVVAMNAPYSGKNGMMFSAYRHAHDHGREALELELRQDLLQSEGACNDLADRVHMAFSKVGLFA
jgi:predicted N-formylglutamate amidohydrolase